jgi:uncharacterized protein (DUF1501 family)
MHNDQDRPLDRRELLKLGAAGVAGASLSGWLGVLAEHSARAAAPPGRRKSCILLWMDGGPSHIDTFDPKPDAPAEVRGDLRAIATTVPGVQVSEKFPKFARLLKHAALLRGLCTDEADHGRARVYMHTGYKPGVGGITYPGLGSTVSAELGRADFPLPSFVVTGTPLGKYEFLTDPGYRGPRHQPLALADPARGVENLRPNALVEDFDDRVSILDQLERGFARTRRAGAAEAHRSALARAVRLMRSEKARAFDLSREPAASRRPYGESKFGQGCLLARRLVEVGVSFVEVYLQNWDTHVKKTADDARALMSQVDDGMSALVSDLKERGLLDSTLVIWMGEFGRTPRINNNGGRDHHSRAWTTVLAGGGIAGGQVIGKTDHQGARVTERPISVKDFMATVCQVLGIDYARKIDTPSGRPIRIVDEGARPIREVLG